MDCSGKSISDPSGSDSLSGDINANSLGYEKLSSGDHDVSSVGCSEVPQALSFANSVIQGQESEGMGGGESIGSLEEKHDGNSDDGVDFCCNGDAIQKQGVVCDALLRVNCNEQNGRKESQDRKLSHVPIVLRNMLEAGAPQTKVDEGRGDTVLLKGGSETDTVSASVNDAPENIKSLETENCGKNDENRTDGISSEFDGVGSEGRNEPSSDQDAGLSDDVSFTQSFLLPDSELDSRSFRCSYTENYLKDSSEIEGNVPSVVSPSLAITEMVNNNDGGPCSYDISEKNEKMRKNYVENSSTESAVPVMRMNMDGANLSLISPIDENTLGMEPNSPITDTSFLRDSPLKFGNGSIEVHSPGNAVELLRIVDGNGRVGDEVASASGTNYFETGLYSSRKRAQNGKQHKVAKTKRSANLRKSSKKKQPEGKLESIFKCSKQKRSSVSKPGCSAEWGSQSRINEIFLQSNNIPYDGPSRHKPQKSQNNPENGEHNVSSYISFVEGSNKNVQASSGSGLRLKLKFGKSGGQSPLNITVSKVSGTSSPANGICKVETGLELPGSAHLFEDKMRTVGTREYSEEKRNPVEKLPYQLSPASIRDEKNNHSGGLCGKLGDDVLDDHPPLSSGIVVECERATGSRPLDAETSPDSEVINSVPDSILSVGHKLGLLHGFCNTPEVVVNKNSGIEKEDELALKSPLENGTHTLGARNGKHPKSKSKGTKKGKSKSKSSESLKGRRKKESCEGIGQHKYTNRSIGRDASNYHEVGRIESCQTSGVLLDADIGKASATNGTISSNVTHGEMVMGGTIDDSSSTESAWVQCDDCFKWRRIPASVAESIDESLRWTCFNNSDKDFADCSKSQEMSNEDINAELGIGQDEADAYDCDVAKRAKEKEQKSKRLAGNQKACFKAIKTNQFLHRNRKSQTIDEIMVCHCKPPPDGRLGCGEECLNRMLNIECLQGTCPAGDLCSNQMFQKRKYVKFERFQSGKKGYGLRLLEDVREGQFLIEYVGEVLDIQSYESRQKDYASKGQKHFYFMTLNGNEVIDAGAKGNLGRFINHSCDPNCRTEKWMVNGEICVGIFSMQDLKKGQELTFDYNYVRVFGAAAKKCYCGSLNCRGYIGGDPSDGDVVVQSDSDEEYPELVIIDDETGEGILDATSKISIDGADVQMPQDSANVNGSKDLAPDNTNSQSSVCVKLPEKEILPPILQPAEVLNDHLSTIPVRAVQQEAPVEKKTKSTSTTPSPLSKLSSDGTNADKMTKHGSGEEKKILPRPHPRMKTSRSSGPSKRDRGGSLPGVSKAQVIPVSKLQQQSVKSKGSEEVSPSGRIETFEGKLNELLDAAGGISKRRDSAKGYLKLLLLTAASRGYANNEGIQSNRDLSMILDALLKTKSKSVLVDVINKNGLQMLHNIMKQYRRDFKKTPILRKLLKVLEYLATREILALEHIIRRPPCAGMESFKDSILTLTEHDDKQVHQIARNFRDRWIPKPFRKPWRIIDREERSDYIRSPINSRFRASQEPRYDHHSPRRSEPFVSAISSAAATPETPSALSEGCSEPTPSLPETNGRKRKSRWDQPAITKQDSNQDLQDDLPPGFSLPCTDTPGAVTAQPQQKFLSRLPVSYGIPLSIVHQFGSPISQDDPLSWSVAPGIPFYPFPPLPPVSHNEFFAKRNEKDCSSSVPNQSYWNGSTAPNRKRGFSSDIGTSYFRQQKQNFPPWMRQSNNGWDKTVNGSIPPPGNLNLEEKLNNS